MSLDAYVPPLRLDRRPSRILFIALTAVHGIALLVLPPLVMAWWVKLPLAMLIMMHWVVSYRHHIAFSAPRAVKHFIWLGDNRWELFGIDGSAIKARLLPTAYVHPLLVVMRFLTEDNHKRAVVLPYDGLDTDGHRQLRVQLRLIEGKLTADS